MQDKYTTKNCMVTSIRSAELTWPNIIFFLSTSKDLQLLVNGDV